LHVFLIPIGPNTAINDGRVISNFIVQALNGDPITIYGDGSQTRSFCFVDDLVNGLMALMNQDKSITGPINLGNPIEKSMIEIADIIIKLTNSKSTITFKTLPQDDPKQRQPNIDLANQTLNWQPSVSLEDGLIKTIDYFKTYLASASH
jgi:Nucleoside-diphosphate-sugar epimerases